MISVLNSSHELWQSKQCRQHAHPVTICIESKGICHIR